MKIATAELIDVALDRAVAQAVGWVHENGNVYLNDWTPSTNWAQGGPIIERMYGLELAVREGEAVAYFDSTEGDPCEGYGPTPLVAAMRCYVASKLGDEIDIPDGVKP